MTRPSSGAPTAITPIYGSSTSITAYSAFQAAFGNHYLCGDCHARKHAPGDWLCRRCRAEVERFELDEVRAATRRLTGEPLDWSVIDRRHTQDGMRVYRKAA